MFKTIILCLALTANLLAYNFNTIDDAENQPLSFREAFTISISENEDDIVVSLNTGDGYYLYVDKTTAQAGDEKLNIDWQNVNIKNDEFFGSSPVVTGATSGVISKRKIKTSSITITAQGCYENKICYIPQSYEFQITTPKNKPISTLMMLSFFVAGVLISLTPCSYPLIPLVLSSIDKVKASSIFLYVNGLAISFVSIGMITTLTGKFIIPYIANIYSALAIATILSVIAYRVLQDKGMPSLAKKTQQIERTLIDKLQINRSLALGIISGLIASPCTTAPMAAIYSALILESNITLSLASLYLVTLGLATPLITIAILKTRINPGPWMNHVQYIIATAITCYAVYLIQQHNPYLGIAFGLIALGVLFVKIKNTARLYFTPSLLALIAYILVSTNSAIVTNRINSLDEVKQSLSIIKIEADWCATCKVNNIALMGINTSPYEIHSVDVTKTTDSTSAFLAAQNILTIPTTLIVKDGIVVHSISGEIKDKELMEILDHYANLSSTN